MNEMDNGEHAINNEMRYFLIGYSYTQDNRISIGRYHIEQKDYPIEIETENNIAYECADYIGQVASLTIISITEMSAEDYKTYFGYR